MSADKNDPKGTVGIAMIGNGFAAEFHTTNYKRTHGVDARLVGVFGPRPEATAEFAARHGYEKTYSSIDELLSDPEVDMVDACVPNSFHENMVVEALDAGKHAVVEKPFTGAFERGERSGEIARLLRNVRERVAHGGRGRRGKNGMRQGAGARQVATRVGVDPSEAVRGLVVGWV